MVDVRHGQEFSLQHGPQNEFERCQLSNKTITLARTSFSATEH
jgi:hypothetical protein